MSDSSRDVDNELARLKEYVAEFRKLVSQFDRTLPRFRWHLTNKLWLDARGMISNESIQSVRDRMLADSGVPPAHTLASADLEQARANATIAWCTKVELFGGPADGQIHYAYLPLAESIKVDVPSINGRRLKPRYRRVSTEFGDTLAFKSGDTASFVTREEMDAAFVGKRPTRYSFVAKHRGR